MKKTRGIFFSVRSHLLMLGVAGMLVTGAQSATAQTFGDFETGMDGFFGSDNSLRTNLTLVGTNVVTNLLNTVTNATLPGLATSGSNVICVTQVPDVVGDNNFDWSLEVTESNATFWSAVSNAVMDTNAFYDIFFDGIYTVAGFPEAGTTNGPTFINHLTAMIMPGPGGWANAPLNVGPPGSSLGTSFTNDFSVEMAIRIEDFANMTPANILAASNTLSMLVALNGNWPTNGVSNDAQMYYDNFRVVKWDGLLYDFESGLQGWFANACASTVVWAQDEPDTGINSMRVLTSGTGTCRGCGVVMTPGQHAYTIMRNLVRYQDPNDFVLKMDMILDTGVLHSSLSFIRPSVSWDLTTFEEVTVVDTNVIPPVTNMFFTNVTTTLGPFTYPDNTVFVSNLTSTITTVPLELPLNVFAWPNDSQYNPVSIQLNIGNELDGSGFPPPINRIYFDNIEIAPFDPFLIEKTDITSISQAGTNVTLKWTSQEPDVDFFGNVTPVQYGVERSTDLEGDSWELLASSWLTSTYPDDRSYTFPVSEADDEYYRVFATDTFEFLVEVPLYDFEVFTNDLEHWDFNSSGLSAGYIRSLTNSTVSSTSGSNSLALTISSVNASNSHYHAIHADIPSGSVQYVEIVNALNDVSNDWHLAVDVIYRADDLLSTSNNWFQIPFFWNSDNPTNGTFFVNDDESANLWVPSLMASSNEEIAVTFSHPLPNSLWQAHTTSNDFWQIGLGAQGGAWEEWTNLTVYFDNIRLSTRDYGTENVSVP